MNFEERISERFINANWPTSHFAGLRLNRGNADLRFSGVAQPSVNTFLQRDDKRRRDKPLFQTDDGGELILATNGNTEYCHDAQENDTRRFRDTFRDRFQMNCLPPVATKQIQVGCVGNTFAREVTVRPHLF